MEATQAMELWHDAHFEISAYLVASMQTPGTLSCERYKLAGRKGIYRLAGELADQFEQQQQGQPSISSIEDFMWKMIWFLTESELKSR